MNFGASRGKFRAMLRLALFAALALVFPACHNDTRTAPTEVAGPPPLPPSSGTAIGYLLDNATDLKLTDDQIKQMTELDRSLAAQNDEIDTQLRAIEKPDEEPPPEKGQPPPRHNNAPGAQIVTTGDAGKLHRAHDMNTQDALSRCFKLLDAGQQTASKKILEQHGVKVGKQPDKKSDGEDGTPLE